MLRTIFYHVLYGPYLKNEDGIKEFAERSLSKLIGKVTRKSSFYREAHENLLVEKANLRLLAEELERKKVLDSGEFFSVRRRLWAGGLIILAVLLLGTFVEYASISVLIQNGASSLDYATWTIAALLAATFIGGGIATVERLLEALLWHRRIEAQAGEPGRYEAVMWGIVLFGIELALLGLADVRAGLLAQQADGSLVYLFFMISALILPVIGGAIRWDTLRYIDAYKRTQAQRHIETRLAQIDSILRQNEEFESNFYKIACLKTWREIVAFKAVKNSFDKANGIKEDLNGHFTASYRTFQEEANWRYETDLRDMTYPSLRKLPHRSILLPPTNKTSRQARPALH